MAWQATGIEFLEWLGGLSKVLGIPWQALHSGFAGLVFLSLAGGVVAFTRRRQDLFQGFSIGWAFGLFLGCTGVLMLTDPFAPATVRDWIRSGQVLTAPLALLLMLAFLLRLRRLEEYEDSEARQANLQTELSQQKERLAHLRKENAELAQQRDQARSEIQRLASERNEASQQLCNLRIREEGSGLYTRAHFLERLREEFERSHRRGALPLPLFIGLQGLEEVAPAEREDALQLAGRIVREGLRLPDLACRFGEAELLVIPSETDSKGTGALAQRLHRRLKKGLARASGSGRQPITNAFVLLEFDVGLNQFEDFLEACNHALEQVRQQPPNRFIRLPARFAQDA